MTRLLRISRNGHIKCRENIIQKVSYNYERLISPTDFQSFLDYYYIFDGNVAINGPYFGMNYIDYTFTDNTIRKYRLQKLWTDWLRLDYQSDAKVKTSEISNINITEQAIKIGKDFKKLVSLLAISSVRDGDDIHKLEVLLNRPSSSSDSIPVAKGLTYEFFLIYFKFLVGMLYRYKMDNYNITFDIYTYFKNQTIVKVLEDDQNIVLSVDVVDDLEYIWNTYGKMNEHES